jgi:hypothetical protein
MTHTTTQATSTVEGGHISLLTLLQPDSWAKDRVPIPRMGFAIGDKLTDVMHVPLVRSGQMHPLSIYLCTKKNIDTVTTEN